MTLLLIIYFLLYLLLRRILKRTAYAKKSEAEKLLRNVQGIRWLTEETLSGDFRNAPLRDYEEALRLSPAFREDVAEDGAFGELMDGVFTAYYRVRFSGEERAGDQAESSRGSKGIPAPDLREERIRSEKLLSLLYEEYLKHGRRRRFRRIFALLFMP